MFFSSDKTIISYLESENKRKIDKAIDLLYEKYFPMIQNYVMTNQGSLTDSQDLFQEAIFVLYKNITKRTFLQNSSLKTYLYSICRNLWLTNLKNGNNLYHSVNLDTVTIPAVFSEDMEEHSEKEKLIEEGLNLLGKKCKDILVAFYYEGLSIDDLSKKFNFSTPAIAKNQKYRCLSYLIAKVKKTENSFVNE